MNQLLVAPAGGETPPAVFFVSGGRVVALDAEGAEMWRSDLLDVSFLEGVHDLAGDGRRQLVVLKWGGLAALDMASGAIPLGIRHPARGGLRRGFAESRAG
ncbi:MAG: hypothetical protein M5R40_05095 [Anaerolineae bacterium]|nr:hypothetical protein [Anaerolineae bacterium]